MSGEDLRSARKELAVVYVKVVYVLPSSLLVFFQLEHNFWVKWYKYFMGRMSFHSPTQQCQKIERTIKR